MTTDMPEKIYALPPFAAGDGMYFTYSEWRHTEYIRADKATEERKAFYNQGWKDAMSARKELK